MHKFRYRLSNIRLCTQATTQYNFKPSYFLTVFIFHFWNKTNVMDKRKCCILFTGRKAKLKLPAEFHADRISKKIFKEAVSIRSHIKRFIRIDTSDAGSGHVPYRITTGLSNGNIVLR